MWVQGRCKTCQDEALDLRQYCSTDQVGLELMATLLLMLGL